MSQGEAFFLSIVIELFVAMVIATGLRRPRSTRLAGAVALGTVITHPVLWAIAPHVPPTSWWPAIVAMEVAIGIIEGGVVAVIGGVGWRDGLVIGVGMNAVSFGAGFVLTPLWS